MRKNKVIFIIPNKLKVKALYNFTKDRFILEIHVFVSSEQSEKTLNIQKRLKMETLKKDDLVGLENLGKGASGFVDKFYHKRFECFVAIKSFQKNSIKALLSEHDLLNRVEEISQLEDKNNKYFLKYYGIFKNTDSYEKILMMETGICSLDDVLKAGKIYTCEELLFVLQNLVEGYYHLQKNGIANRDIKPKNIILVEDQKQKERFYYKISDFGIGVFSPSE